MILNDNFTIEAYKEYLMLLIKTYQFVDYESALTSKSKFVILRHDIDFSIDNSLRLAEIESNLGVFATYFVHLHSEYYNFLDKNIQKKLGKIAEMGHKVELHLCCDYYNITTEDNLLDAITKDSRLFKENFSENLRTFSFHNPTLEALAFENNEYLGLINTYSKFFKNNTVYASDSNGYWRHKSIGNTIKDNLDKNLHILTHPIWWTENIDSPRNKIKNCLNSYAEERLNNYDAILSLQGRQNIK